MIEYQSIGFTEQTLKFWRQISKIGGAANARFIKPTLYSVQYVQNNIVHNKTSFISFFL